MNIFFRELRAYRRTTIIWTAALCALMILFFPLYYSLFTQDVAAVQNLLNNLPAAVRDVLGISLQNFFTIFGLYAYLYTFVTLTGAVQAMNIGTGIISKEDAAKTSDFLLSKPVTRTKVVTSKLAAALAVLLFTNTVFIAVSFATTRIVSNQAFSLKIFLLISFTLLLVQLAFLALGMIFSVTIPKIKSVISVSLPTVFAFFIIGTLSEILGVESTRYLTPFKFYDAQYIIKHGAYETRFLILEAVFILIALTASFFIYLRKDVRAAS